jgi:peptidyl-prolyl cis-trans isomerase C
MKPFFNVCKIVTALAVSAALLMPAAALAAGNAAKAQTPVNVALVNGKAIPFKDFQWELEFFQKRMQAHGQPSPETTAQLKKQVINDMILREVLFQESIKKGIKVDPKTIKDEISAIRLRFPDQKKFDGWLASMNMSEAKLKDQISRRHAIKDLIDKEIAPNIKVTDKDSKAFYKNNPNYFQRPEEVHAQHILIKVPKDASDQQKAEARKKLLKLKKRIDAGEDFGKLAKSYSQGPSASRNGDLGFFPKGRMVPAFEKVAFELKPGQVSDIVETQFGYHLIKVLEHRAASTISFEEAQPRITASLEKLKLRSEVQNYAEKLRKEAKIKVFVQ